MTPFTVDWKPDVLDELTALWLAAPDRRAVTDAQARIDSLLARDPTQLGLHLSAGLYRLDVAPLAVTYTVDQQHKRVEIDSVRRI